MPNEKTGSKLTNLLLTVLVGLFGWLGSRAAGSLDRIDTKMAEVETTLAVHTEQIKTVKTDMAEVKGQLKHVATKDELDAKFAASRVNVSNDRRNDARPMSPVVPDDTQDLRN
jgi:hypothetical protein